MMPSTPCRYVHVEADGAVRELHPDERKWLETEYTGGDGTAPYVKDSYDERNGWGDLAGFLERSKLPDGIMVGDAPAENPSRGMNEEEYIAFLHSKGLEVVKNADGSLTVLGKKKVGRPGSSQ